MQEKPIFPNINLHHKVREWFKLNSNMYPTGNMLQAISLPGGKLENILWYAKGDDWLFNKLIVDNYIEKIGNYIFEFEIDEEQIYHISNIENVVKNNKTLGNRLNWPKLVLDANYCGLYVDMYGKEDDPIFKLFQVSSGCIWNTKCVKSVKLLAQYDEIRNKYLNKNIDLVFR
jgi:hypothetical protein